MDEINSTTIIPIAFYSFILGIYIVFSVISVVINNPASIFSQDFSKWLPWASLAIFGVGFIWVSVGFVNLSKLCWKILFFSLVICILGSSLIIILFLLLLLFNASFIFSYFQANQITPGVWLPFLFAFLSGIIVLYYLVHKDVVSSFGGMDQLLPPF